MRKVILVLAAAALCLSGCKKSTENALYDGTQVILQKYADIELTTSDTLLIENMQFFADGEILEEGVYYVFSQDPLVPSELINGLPIYVDVNGASGTIKDSRLFIAGNPANEAYQRLRDDLFPLKKQAEEIIIQFESERRASSEPLPVERVVYWEDKIGEVFYQQAILWDNYFAEHLWHPLGEEVFLYDFDYEGVLVKDPAIVKQILSYAEESFLSHPDIFEIMMIIARSEE